MAISNGDNCVMAAHHVVSAIDQLRRKSRSGAVADEAARVHDVEELLRLALGTTERLGLFDLCGQRYEKWNEGAEPTFHYAITQPGGGATFEYQGYSFQQLFTFRELMTEPSKKLPWFPRRDLALWALCASQGIPLGGELKAGPTEAGR